ncbi:MAG: methionyl-tRNA formyltransferase [Acidimicrobiia bacterium]
MTAPGRLRVAFLGTPDAAVPSLRALASIAEIPIVITQPDRPQGRSRAPQPPPVKVTAEAMGIPVAQPERSGDIASMLEGAGPLDAAVLVAFGQLIRPDALAVPRRGFLNVHFSILPRWRGAAPVQRAIMAGDRRMGVTVMVLEAGLDTGPTVATWSTGLGASESGGAVLARLSDGGAALMAEVLEPYVHGRLAAVAQPAGATPAAKITSVDRAIDWTESAVDTSRRVVALSPRPGAFTHFRGQPFKILAAEAVGGEGEPGLIDPSELTVGTGAGRLRLIEVQPAGRTPMNAADWARGLSGEPGRFG